MSDQSLSPLKLYLGYTMVSILVATGALLVHHRIVLELPLDDLTPRFFAVPVLLGLGFGVLIATLARRHQHTPLLPGTPHRHDRLLERELHERRRAEESLRRQTQELRAANQELESFGHAISHDLRAPLRRISGFSMALAETCREISNPLAVEHATRIHRACEHMDEMIDNLLALSRVTGVQLQPASTNLSLVAHEIVEELRAAEPERQIEVDIAPGLIAEGDTRLLRHVMENLIGNAWKFTARTDAARIEIGSYHDRDRHVFYVRDNGVGFDPRYTDQIFLPFRRLHPDSEFEGSGIGLATVQRIIRRHGGWIRAQGQVGAGAEISFVLNGLCESAP